MSKAKYLCVALSVVPLAQSYAQSRPATDLELEQIRIAQGVDNIPEYSRYTVLSVEGRYEGVQGAGRLWSRVRFQPYPVQGALCLMEVTYRTASDIEGSFRWDNAQRYYAYWKGQSPQDCELEDASEIPADMFSTNDSLPTSALAEIVYRADELSRLGLEYAVNETDFEAEFEPGSDIPDRLREMYREYRDGPPLRLRGVDIRGPGPVTGFTYHASFGSENATDGPVVIFSVTANGFVIHAVGRWIA